MSGRVIRDPANPYFTQAMGNPTVAGIGGTTPSGGGSDGFGPSVGYNQWGNPYSGYSGDIGGWASENPYAFIRNFAASQGMNNLDELPWGQLLQALSGGMVPLALAQNGPDLSNVPGFMENYVNALTSTYTPGQKVGANDVLYTWEELQGLMGGLMQGGAAGPLDSGMSHLGGSLAGISDWGTFQRELENILLTAGRTSMNQYSMAGALADLKRKAADYQMLSGTGMAGAMEGNTSNYNPLSWLSGTGWFDRWF